MGLVFGKSWRARRLSMMATLGCLASSAQVKSRPARNGTASVRKKLGEISSSVAVTAPVALVSESVATVSLYPLVLAGMGRLENAADCTPGRLAIASAI